MDGALRLIRYMPFPRLLALLNDRLTFTPLRLLGLGNDPSECQPITDSKVIVNELRSIKRHGAFFRELKRGASKWARIALESNAPYRNDYLARRFHEYIGETRAASCWFANNFESAAMWASYAPQGVAVEADLDGIKSALPSNREFIIAAVRYRIRDKFRIDAGNAEGFPHMLLRPYLLKGREFEHEKEVRIVTRCGPDQEWFHVRARRFIRCIRRVVISPYIDPDSASGLKKHIEALLEEKFVRMKTPLVEFSSINRRFMEQRAARAITIKRYYAREHDKDSVPL